MLTPIGVGETGEAGVAAAAAAGATPGECSWRWKRVEAMWGDFLDGTVFCRRSDQYFSP